MMTDATDATAEAGSGTMQPFRSILAVCGYGAGDAHSLKLATDLAQTGGAAVTALAVVELPSEIERLSRAAGVSREEIERRLVAEQEEQLAKLVAEQAADHNVTITVRVGKAFLEIVRQVLDHEHDLAVKTAEELQGLHSHLFASTDQHLLRKCPCPVWLQRPEGRQQARTVLAAVDVSELAAGGPETQTGLNRRIVETAARIGMAEGAAVHVLHVWDAPGEGMVRLWSGTPSGNEAAKRYVSDIESVHWNALDQLVEQARGWLGPGAAQRVKLKARLERGAARSVIPRQVEALKADILVMGTIARTGVPGFIIGNTAEDILNSVNCSVVTVKPPGYVSPLVA